MSVSMKIAQCLSVVALVAGLAGCAAPLAYGVAAATVGGAKMADAQGANNVQDYRLKLAKMSCPQLTGEYARVDTMDENFLQTITSTKATAKSMVITEMRSRNCPLP